MVRKKDLCADAIKFNSNIEPTIQLIELCWKLEFVKVLISWFYY